MPHDETMHFDSGTQQQNGGPSARQAEGPREPECAPARDDYALTQRIDRLVQAVLEGRIVPFLGAGISMRAPPRRGHEGAAPTLKAIEIAELLSRALHEKNPSEKRSRSSFPNKAPRKSGA